MNTMVFFFKKKISPPKKNNNKNMWLVKSKTLKLPHIFDSIFAAGDSPGANQHHFKSSCASLLQGGASTSNAPHNHLTATNPITGVWRGSCCAVHANTRFEMDRDGMPPDLSLPTPLTPSLSFEGKKKKQGSCKVEGREGQTEEGRGDGQV